MLKCMPRTLRRTVIVGILRKAEKMPIFNLFPKCMKLPKTLLIFTENHITAGKSSCKLLQIVNTDDLVDPTNERRDLDIDSGHVFAAAAKSPRNEASQLVVTSVFANQGAASVTLQKLDFIVKSRKNVSSDLPHVPDMHHGPLHLRRKNWRQAKWKSFLWLRWSSSRIRCRWPRALGPRGP